MEETSAEEEPEMPFEEETEMEPEMETEEEPVMEAETEPEAEAETEPEMEPEMEHRMEVEAETEEEHEEVIPQEPQQQAQQEDYYPYEPILFGDMDEKDETGFEIQETLGDKLLEEDHSLAAKLQHKQIKDLKSAIGINDKFLLVNELFGGSMERYNKSIENLNDLPTKEGALGYLDELYVEYQWNRNNEAYKKLLELVHRKFEEN